MGLEGFADVLAGDGLVAGAEETHVEQGGPDSTVKVWDDNKSGLDTGWAGVAVESVVWE